jgi:hypothetical protein
LLEACVVFPLCLQDWGVVLQGTVFWQNAILECMQRDLGNMKDSIERETEINRQRERESSKQRGEREKSERDIVAVTSTCYISTKSGK